MTETEEIRIRERERIQSALDVIMELRAQGVVTLAGRGGATEVLKGKL